MPFVSPFHKRERALPTIGNKRGSAENKNFPGAIGPFRKTKCSAEPVRPIAL